MGVDPETNDLPAGRAVDRSSSSPVVLPDGTILCGACTRHNYARGHLLRLGADGCLLATCDFGWDITTPAAFSHAGTFSVVPKDNRYAVGSYRNDPIPCPPASSIYALAQLDPALRPEWRYLNTISEACTRAGDRTVQCSKVPWAGFEWCFNQPAVDATGVVLGDAEDEFV